MPDAPPDDLPTLSHLYWERGRDARERANLCVIVLLAWVSACDGTFGDGEEELLRRMFAAGTSEEDLNLAMRIARRASIDDLELACRHVQRHLGRNQKRLLAELAIAIAYADAELTIAENHALQFVADLVAIRPRAFLKLYQQLTGQPLCAPGDPSSASWWDRADAGRPTCAPWDLPEERPLGHQNDATTSAAIDTAAPKPMTRAEATRLLGLPLGATAEQVHQAYRRAAKLRHPDRFAGLGPAAVAVATEVFQRINEAHALLLESRAA